MESFIKTDNVQYVYKSGNPEDAGVKAVSGITLEIEKGQFVAVIGRNGSGKSTYARLLNAILTPSTGTVYVKGMNTMDESLLWEIRRTAGMTFQNPDNQIIGTTVEEDIAFGPENLGVPPEEIRQRVDDALKVVDISEFAERAPHLLSGGQKQRVSIAGVLAMKPECLILDEATSMLDPAGRREIMNLIKRLNKEEKITVILITHHMDEAEMADRVIVVDKGLVVMDGTPRSVFSEVEKIKELGLDVPQVTELFYELQKEGLNLPKEIFNADEAYKALKEAFNK